MLIPLNFDDFTLQDLLTTFPFHPLFHSFYCDNVLLLQLTQSNISLRNMSQGNESHEATPRRSIQDTLLKLGKAAISKR